MSASKLLYPTVIVAALAVMTAYLELPIPSLGAAALVFLLLLIQLASARRVQVSTLVPPEFQAKLASLENQNSRQLKQLNDQQFQIDELSKKLEDESARSESHNQQKAAYEASIQHLQNALEQSQGGDEQAVIQFVRNLQARGRFLDFVMADIHRLPDEQVGAVSRVVHQGLRDLMDDYFGIKPIASEAEGDRVLIPKDSVGKNYSLVQSKSEIVPEHGVLLHRGWQAARMKLPQSQKAESHTERLMFAPAEIDVSDAQRTGEGLSQ